jgi:hypothetical protein
VVNCGAEDRMPHCGHKPSQHLSHLIAGTAALKCPESIRSSWRKVKWRKAGGSRDRKFISRVGLVLAPSMRTEYA